MMTNRLTNIATRQQQSFVRDVVFASVIALAALVGVASVSTAVSASSSAQLASR
ncbi:hypothetical protein BH11MYX2_BH11MYX2_39910 [soil metagenome]